MADDKNKTDDTLIVPNKAEVAAMIADALTARIGELPEGKTVILVIGDAITDLKATIGEQKPEGYPALSSEAQDQVEKVIDNKLADFKPTISPEDIAEQLQGMDWHAIAAEAQAKAADARRANDAAAEAERQKSQDKADKQAAKRASDAAAERSARQQSATKQFQQLFGDGSTPATADLSLLPNTSITLLVDNGETFCVDVVIDPLDRATLRQIDDRSIQLDRKIDLGKGIAEAFTVHGVDLIFGASDALRCELATPLTIGGGREAHLPEGSLVFRAQPPVSTEAF